MALYLLITKHIFIYFKKINFTLLSINQTILNYSIYLHRSYLLGKAFVGICSIFMYSSLFAQVERLSVGINSEYSETNLVVSPDGKSLYFSRKNHPQNRGDEGLEDIWVSYNNDFSDWTMAVNLGSPINSNSQNAAIGISMNNNQLYLKGLYSDTTNTILWQSQRENLNEWGEPTPLSIPRFWSRKFGNNYQVSHDGNILLICNDGIVSISLRKTDENFTQPRNMGNAINPTDENGRPLSNTFAATLAADMRTLFFAARRGDEKIKIFRTQRLDETWQEWTTPEALDVPYSLPTDISLSLPLASDWLYFTATDPETLQSDVFRLALPTEIRPKSATLVEGQTYKKMKLQLKNLDNSQVKNIDSQENGKFIALLQDWKNASISAATSEEGEGISFLTESQYLHIEGKNLNEIDTNSLTNNFNNNTNANTDDEARLDEIRLRLRKLDEEITQIEGNLFKQNVFNLPNEIVTPQRPHLAKTTDLRSKNVPQPIEEPSSGDIKLDELRRKFKKNQPPTANKNQPQSEANNAENKNTHINHSSSSTSVYTEDQSLLELRQKYNKLQGAKTPVAQPKSVTPPPSVTTPKDNFNPNESSQNSLLTTEILAAEWENICRENMLLQLEDVRRDIERNISNTDERRLLTTAFREKQRTLQDELKRVGVSPIQAEVRDAARKVLSETAKKTFWKEQFKQQIQLELAWNTKQLLLKKWQNDLQQTIKQTERNREKRRRETIEESQENANDAQTNVFSDRLQLQNNKITLRRIVPEIGQKWVLNNLFFEPNSADLRPISSDELERLLYFLKQNSTINIEISAHTNGKCSPDFAQRLTQMRAETIANYLENNGIQKQRLRIRAAANNEPRNTNDSPQGLRNNQRIEIKIIR